MPDNDLFAPKGKPRPLGGQTCGYKPATAVDYCGKPGTWHVMWDGALDNSITCDEHMPLIQQQWMYDDRHPIAADCAMPGALWMYRLGKCEVPDSDASLTNSVKLEVRL